MDDDLDDEEENTFSRKVRSISESTYAEDYDPEDNDESDYDPVNNDELDQLENNFIVTNAQMKQQRHSNFSSVKTVHGSAKRVWKKTHERSISIKQ